MNYQLHEPMQNTPKLLPIFVILIAILLFLLGITYWLASRITPSSKGGYQPSEIAGTSWSADMEKVSPTPALTPSALEGWFETYFADTRLETRCGDTRLENDIFLFRDTEASWSLPEGCPSASEPWSVRMEHKGLLFYGGTYEFELRYDDAARLLVDDAIVIDGWDHAQQTIKLDLTPGYHSLIVEYRNTTGSAIMELWWRGPGAIPITRQARDPEQWWASYWGNQSQWQDPVIQINENTTGIDHNWGTAQPGWGLSHNHFSTRFQRIIFLDCGSYEFRLSSDDGSRLTLDGEVVPGFDHWQADKWDTAAELKLETGYHEVIVDSFERRGEASVSLDWNLLEPCIPETTIPSLIGTPSTPTPCPDCSLAVGAWPMFRKDLQHSGRSEFYGPVLPELDWRYETTSSFGSDPAIGSDGNLYVGLGNSMYSFSSDGKVLWSFATSAAVKSPLIAADGTIYFGNEAGYIYALWPTGTLRWAYETGGWVSASPALGTDGTLYIGSSDGYFYALHPNGTLKWKYKVGSWINSSAAIGGGGILYFGSTNRSVYALNLDGTLRWKYLTGGFIDSSPVLGADGTLYIGSIDQHLYAINPDGTLKWRFATGGAVGSSPAIAPNGTVYVGSEDGHLYALNPNGTLKWRYATFERVQSSPAIGADGTVYFGSDDTLLYALNPDGALLWGVDVSTKPLTKGPILGADGRLYFGGAGTIFCVHDTSTISLTPTKTSTSYYFVYPTATRTATPTRTKTTSPTQSSTNTPTRTGTLLATSTNTTTSTMTPTRTHTPTPTSTPTTSPTHTPTLTLLPESSNLAINQPVTVSSYEDADHMGAMAVDDTLTTYWQSERTSGQTPLPAEWLVVDLGANARLERVVLDWDRYYATSFAIQVSQDLENWITVFTTAAGDGGSDSLILNPITARYVKFNSTAWNNRLWRCWLNEFQVFGVYTP